MKRFITVFLSLILLASIALISVACNKQPEQSGKTSTDVSTDDKPANDPSVIKKYTYRQEIADSNVSLVSNGESDYVIVYPDGDDAMIKTAVKELKQFFGEATGIEIAAYKDGEYVTGGLSNPYISIGETTQFSQAGLSVDKTELGVSGYEIKLVGNNVYIAGGYYGNLYGVYEFLAYEFGFEAYAPDEIYIEKKDSVKLKAFALKDIPDAEYRVGGNGENSGYAGGDVMNRYRMMTLTNVFVGGWGADEIPPFHNYLEYITPGEFAAEHPDWFSPSGTQVCLTRDPEGLMDALVPKMIEQLDLYPTRNIITFTQMDGPTWCTCDKCRYTGQAAGESGDAFSFDASTAEREYYSAQNIRFMNKLAKRINEEYTVENGHPNGRYVYVYLFNYGMTSACPIKYDSQGQPVLDANGNYQIFDDSLEIAENLGVLFCYGFQTSYDKDEQYNDVTLTTIDKVKRWMTISKHFAFWAYSTNFDDYFTPYDSVQQLQDTCKFVHDNNGQMYYNMAQYDTPTPVDWGRLESYLSAKLSWNRNADVGALTDEFFEHYFRAAAPAMKKLYDAYKVKMAYLADEKGVGIAINSGAALLKEEYWKYNELEEFLAMIDDAYDAIAYLQNEDIELYTKVHDRINIESMIFRYMLYRLYPDKFDYDLLQSLQSEMIAECRALGIDKAKEHYDISSLFD